MTVDFLPSVNPPVGGGEEAGGNVDGMDMSDDLDNVIYAAWLAGKRASQIADELELPVFLVDSTIEKYRIEFAGLNPYDEGTRNAAREVECARIDDALSRMWQAVEDRVMTVKQAIDLFVKLSRLRIHLLGLNAAPDAPTLNINSNVASTESIDEEVAKLERLLNDPGAGVDSAGAGEVG